MRVHNVHVARGSLSDKVFDSSVNNRKPLLVNGLIYMQRVPIVSRLLRFILLIFIAVAVAVDVAAAAAFLAC